MMRKARKAIFVSVVCGTLSMGCGKKKSTDTPANVVAGPGFSGVSTQMKSINSALVPQSLAFPSSFQFNKESEPASFSSGNPCQGYNLFTCQPVLLRLYLSLNKQMGAQILTALDEINTHLASVADGATGTVTDNGQTISYTKTNNANFSILVKTAAAVPFIFVSYANSAFKMQINIAAMPSDSSGGPSQGVMEIFGTYTDNNNWNVTTQMIGMDCQDNDVGAPANIRVQVAKANGLWKGKAYQYNPRWLGSNTCSTAPSDTTAASIFTDFVADDAAAKASVYIMPRTVIDMSTISNYALNKLVTNFPAVFGGQSADLSAFPNPFCNPTSTMAATWNSTCVGSSSPVADADFDPSVNWLTPVQFAALAVTMPTTL